MLPIEFARQSRDGRIALLVENSAETVPVLWVRLGVGSIDDGVDEFGVPIRRPRSPLDQPPSDRVASAPVLFKRLGAESERIEPGCGRVLEITAAQRRSFGRLHDLRNGFTHFSPRGWSIELRLIEDMVPAMPDVIAQIADDCWPFRHMSAQERELLSKTLSELRRRFSDPSAGTSPT